MPYLAIALSTILEQFVASVGVPIESFSYRAQSVVQTQQGELSALAQVWFVAPDLYREDSTMSFGKIVTVRRGDQGWAATPRGVSELTAEQHRRTVERLYRNYLGLVWAASDGRVQAKEMKSGEVILSVGGLEMRARFERGTGRLAELSMPGSNLAGAPVTEKHLFSDFDPETNLPNRITVHHDDEMAADITMERWTLNESLPPDLFVKPTDAAGREP